MGIDVGTSGTRAIVIDATGSILGAATAEYPLHTPKPLWAEQDPGDWWRAATQVMRQAIVASGVTPREIACVGLTGQMHGTVFLDEQSAVIRPAMLWCDQRTDAECAWVTARVGAVRLAELTCNLALTGFSAPKIVWLREHEPTAYARLRKVLITQGLSALSAYRRVRDRGLRCLGHVAVRRSPTPMVGRDSGKTRDRSTLAPRG